MSFLKSIVKFYYFIIYCGYTTSKRCGESEPKITVFLGFILLVFVVFITTILDFSILIFNFKSAKHLRMLIFTVSLIISICINISAFFFNKDFDVIINRFSESPKINPLIAFVLFCLSVVFFFYFSGLWWVKLNSLL